MSDKKIRREVSQMEETHKLLLVAFSICSSKAVLAEDDHQLIILANGRHGLSVELNWHAAATDW